MLGQVGSIFEVPVYATGRLRGLAMILAITPWVRLLAVAAFFAGAGASLTSYAAGSLVAEGASLAALSILVPMAGGPS
jgi:hypothetical protein